MANILVVDDERFVINAIIRVLRSHTITGAINGADGLALVQSGQVFDLIISDTNMPEMDGPAMVRAIRQAGVQTPILMNSAADLQDEVKDLLKSGEIQGFIDKPFRSNELLRETVETLLKTNT